MNEYIDEKLVAPLRKVGPGPFDRAISTSATAAAIVCAVNRVTRAHREEADRLKASVSRIRKFYRELIALDRQLVQVEPQNVKVPGANVGRVAQDWRIKPSLA